MDVALVWRGLWTCILDLDSATNRGDGPNCPHKVCSVRCGSLPSGLPPGRLVTVLGLVNWRAVVRLMPWRHSADDSLGVCEGPATPWILYAIGVGSRLALVGLTGRFGYVGDPSVAVSTAGSYQQVLNLLSLCAPLAVAAAAVRLYLRARIWRAAYAQLDLHDRTCFWRCSGRQAEFHYCRACCRYPVYCRTPSNAESGTSWHWASPFCLSSYLSIRHIGIRFAVPRPCCLLPRVSMQHQAILRQTIAGSDALTTLPDSVTYLLQRLREIDGPAIILQRTPAQVSYSSPTGPGSGSNRYDCATYILAG